jgi:hypothetical protein
MDEGVNDAHQNALTRQVMPMNNSKGMGPVPALTGRLAKTVWQNSAATIACHKMTTS